MKKLIIFLLITVFTSAGIKSWSSKSILNRAIFTQNKNFLNITLPININNSPATTQTSSNIDKENKIITLSFCIIQNRDLYHRSLRTININWDLPNINKNQYKFKFNGINIDLNSKEIKNILDYNEYLKIDIF